MWLEIGKHEATANTDLNLRQMRNTAIMVAPPFALKSHSVPYDRLTREDKTPDLGFITPNTIVTFVGLNVISDLDTDQGKVLETN